MKRMITISSLGPARLIELSEVIVISAEWLQANFGPHAADARNVDDHQEKPRADPD